MDDDQVLVRVRAVGLNPYDWHFMRGQPYLARLYSGWRKPKQRLVMGSDIAGEVEAVGGDVTEFRPGDAVFGFVGTGGLGEFIACSGRALLEKPANLTFEQAAAVPLAALTAVEGLRDYGRIRPTHHVVVNGASGGVGTFAVQIAKSFGAQVTGVCGARNVDLVRNLGADHVVDYTREDVTQSKDRYDLVFDTVGNHSLSKWRSVMASNGTFVSIAGLQPVTPWLGPLRSQVQIALASRFGEHRMVLVSRKVEKNNSLRLVVKKEDLRLLKELIEAGKVSPVIDRTYPLERASDAIRYLEEGRASGKVVVTI
jgi:NADPH:quinone reductase-like Zn-dependent oxidoreductase